MKLPVVWLPEAATEFRGAVQWYAKVNGRFGLRFAQMVDDTVDAIAEAPEQFAEQGPEASWSALVSTEDVIRLDGSSAICDEVADSNVKDKQLVPVYLIRGRFCSRCHSR